MLLKIHPAEKTNRRGSPSVVVDCLFRRIGRRISLATRPRPMRFRLPRSCTTRSCNSCTLWGLRQVYDIHGPIRRLDGRSRLQRLDDRLPPNRRRRRDILDGTRHPVVGRRGRSGSSDVGNRSGRSGTCRSGGNRLLYGFGRWSAILKASTWGGVASVRPGRRCNDRRGHGRRLRAWRGGRWPWRHNARCGPGRRGRRRSGRWSRAERRWRGWSRRGRLKRRRHARRHRRRSHRRRLVCRVDRLPRHRAGRGRRNRGPPPKERIANRGLALTASRREANQDGHEKPLHEAG